MIHITDKIQPNKFIHVQNILGRTGGRFHPATHSISPIMLNGLAMDIWYDINFEDEDDYNKFSVLRSILDQKYF